MKATGEGEQRRRVGLGWALAILIGVSLTAMSCSSKNDVAASTSASSSAAAPRPAVPHLPTPYAGVRLGMAEADLKKLFPPAEDISKCAPRLIGGDVPSPTLVPGAEKKARAQCARALDVAGPTLAERKKLAVAAAELTGGSDPVDMADAILYMTAQVRGVVRVGGIPDAAVVEAARGKSSTAYGAVLPVVGEFVDGAFTFARSKQTRRPLCAVIAESCDDLDPERVRTYVQGGYSLGQIDADAHSRVVYGKCRSPFLQGEKKLQNKLVKRAGLLGAIGLARATQGDHIAEARRASELLLLLLALEAGRDDGEARGADRERHPRCRELLVGGGGVDRRRGRVVGLGKRGRVASRGAHLPRRGQPLGR